MSLNVIEQSHYYHTTIPINLLLEIIHTKKTFEDFSVEKLSDNHIRLTKKYFSWFSYFYYDGIALEIKIVTANPENQGSYVELSYSEKPRGKNSIRLLNYSKYLGSVIMVIWILLIISRINDFTNVVITLLVILIILTIYYFLSKGIYNSLIDDTKNLMRQQLMEALSMKDVSLKRIKNM